MTFEQYSLLWDEGFKAFKSGEENLPNLRLHDYEEVKAWLMGYYAAKENNNDDNHSSYDDKEAAEAVCRFLNREHITDGSPCWCEPETVYKDPDTGVSVIVHRRPQ